ncbi:MAG: serine kinase, partial [Pseudolabrys sp.]
IEIHGLGIRQIEFEPIAVVGLVVDLSAADAARNPLGEARGALIQGITLPRLPVAAGIAALPLVLATLGIPPVGN